MKKHVYILTTIFAFLLLPSIISADCTKEELSHFKSLEDEFKVTYEYDKESKDYTISIINPEYEKYNISFGNDNNSQLDTNIENNMLKLNIHNVKPGDFYYEIFGATETCDDMLKKKTITIPKYNVFNEDPLCQGIEEFVLCRPEYDKDISYEEFVSRVATYKNSRIIKEQEKEAKNIDRDNKVIEYINNNYQILLIIGTAIIAIVLIIILIVKNIKQSRRLE